MTRIFGISRSGYYKWLHRKPQKRDNQNKEIAELIKQIQEKCRYGLGAVKVTEKLYESGLPVNHKRTSRLMRENGLNFRPKRRFKICTVNGKNDVYAPNILGRRFAVTEANRAWVSDITYVRTYEGWLYLCVIIDLFSRKVVGYAAAETMSVDLVLSAFWQAVKERKPQPGLLFHSDRGTQYCAKRFRNALRSQKMFQSMSRKANCWDNACAETFFRSFKNEWFYDVGHLNRKEVKSLIFEYIQIFYNRYRPHYSLGLKSPDDFERKMA